MGIGDKIANAAEQAKGKVQQAAGRALDDPKLEGEGMANEAAGKAKQVGEHVKDAVGDIADKAADAARDAADAVKKATK